MRKSLDTPTPTPTRTRGWSRHRQPSSSRSCRTTRNGHTATSTLAEQIRLALGEKVLAVEHIGSTSVPGLGAKDVIDIDLTVADPRDEGGYVPALEEIGYVLTVREPSFHQHRCLRLSEPRVNLHVFGPDCPETIRHRMFRDWLSTHPEDRTRYENAKRAAIPGGGNVMDYNSRKQQVIRDIYDRLFRAAGML